jgi:DNA-directed RNA polymerase subunit M/transcription elongation factor TFIIS
VQRSHRIILDEEKEIKATSIQAGSLGWVDNSCSSHHPREDSMFDFTCPACQQRRLIFPSQIRHLVNDDEGIVLVFTCWCGALGAMRTGAADAADRHVLAS